MRKSVFSYDRGRCRCGDRSAAASSRHRDRGRAGAAAEERAPPTCDPQPFNPQMSALMNMIIQPRHAKLGLAGQAENWALAGYYFKELKARLRRRRAARCRAGRACRFPT